MSTPKSGVQVTIKNIVTNEEHTLNTNSEGIALFEDIPIGTYDVSIVMPDGFEFKADSNENVIIDSVSGNNNVDTRIYHGLDCSIGSIGEATMIIQASSGGTTKNPPTLSATTTSSLGETTVTAIATLTSNGNDTITERGFCWSTSQNPISTDNHHVVDSLSTPTQFTYGITGLTAGTTYYIRAFATNSQGTAYGTQATINTNAHVSTVKPTVTTNTTYTKTSNSIAIGGNVTAAGDSSVTQTGLCWSTTVNPIIGGTNTLIIGSGTGTFSGTITGLVAEETYFVRAYATNAAGTSYGNNVGIVTDAASPTVSNPSVSTVSYTNSGTSGNNAIITLNGNVTADGGATIVRRGFAWKLGGFPVLDEQGTSSVNVQGTTGTFSLNITDLIPGGNYTFYAFAINAEGLSDYGSSLTFTAELVQIAPTVDINAPSSPSFGVIDFSGEILSTGNSAITEAGFYYKLGSSDQPWVGGTKIVCNKSTVGIMEAQVTGLIPGETYTVRAFATNSAGTTYGPYHVSFTMASPSAPTVTISYTGTPTSTSFILNGSVVNENGTTVTERGFYYIAGNSSQNALLGTRVLATGDNSSFTKEIIGLIPSTLYQVIAFAGDGIIEGHGVQGERSTAATVATAVPTVINKPATNLETTSYTINGEITNNGGGPIIDHGFIVELGAGDPVVAGGVWYEAGPGNVGTFHYDAITTTPGEVISYKAYAQNSVGIGYAPDFITVDLPDATVDLATVVTNSALDADIEWGTATLSYIVTDDANGQAVTESGIIIEGIVVPGGSGVGYNEVLVMGLAEHTSYQYRAYAINPAGTAYGEYLSFYTKYIPDDVPSVDSSNPALVTSTSANFVGVITDDGRDPITKHGFYYKTGTITVSADVKSGGTNIERGVFAGTLSEAFASSISGLSVNTTYTYVVYAENSIGESLGQCITFTTLSSTPNVPTISNNELSSRTSTSITISYTIAENTASNNLIEHGLEIGGVKHPNTGTTPGIKSMTLSDLTPETNYTIRAYATNADGSGYGNNIETATLASYIVGNAYHGGVIYKITSTDIYVVKLGSTAVDYATAYAEQEAANTPPVDAWELGSLATYTEFNGIISLNSALVSAIGFSLSADYWGQEPSGDNQAYYNFTNGEGYKLKTDTANVMLFTTATKV